MTQEEHYQWWRATNPTAVEADAKSMTLRQRATEVQPKKRTSEGIERSSDTPEHGDVPMPKFWQPAVKP
eukprot:6622378-Lingulodinium_polyedra.AAC.1